MARKWPGGPSGIWFSDEHEGEAREAQLGKTPGRFGTWILRRLGYKGEIKQHVPQDRPDLRTSTPSGCPPQTRSPPLNSYPLSAVIGTTSAAIACLECPTPGRGHLLGTHGPKWGNDAELGVRHGRQWRI